MDTFNQSISHKDWIVLESDENMNTAYDPSRPTSTSRVEKSSTLGWDNEHELFKSIPCKSVVVPPESRLVVTASPHSAGADRFRHLRNSLKQQRWQKKLKSIVVVSALPHDGKSTVTMNLASALAEGRESVLCIEADVYNPTIGRSVSYDAPLGLAECIIDGIDPLSAIVRFEPLRWHFLSAGQKRSDPSTLLDADAVGQVLRRLENYFDWIVMDTAPLGPIRDTVGLISQADGALLVVRAEQTPQNLVDESLKLIGRKHALGIVLNASVDLNATYEDYYGRYYKP